MQERKGENVTIIYLTAFNIFVMILCAINVQRNPGTIYANILLSIVAMIAFVFVMRDRYHRAYLKRLKQKTNTPTNSLEELVYGLGIPQPVIETIVHEFGGDGWFSDIEAKEDTYYYLIIQEESLDHKSMAYSVRTACCIHGEWYLGKNAENSLKIDKKTIIGMKECEEE